MNFKPWVGQRYENRELFGLKILLLGESHYGEPGEENENFTTEVVRCWGQQRRHSFFTITAKFVLGKGTNEWPSDEERKNFWEKAALYNYVQELVGNDSRIRPTEEMWEKETPVLLDAIVAAQKAFNNQIKPTPNSGATY